VFEELVKIKDSLTGYRITQQPKLMRHFTCRFEKLEGQADRSTFN